MKLLSSARAISPQMATLLVNQANRELDASRLYLSASLFFEYRDLPGSRQWCRDHSMEEREHALKIFDHLAMRKCEKHAALSKEQLTEWKINDLDPESGKMSSVWAMALEQEVQNSKHYFEMAQHAEGEGDYITREFLNWFLAEQLREENAVADIYSKALSLEKSGGLYSAMDKDFVGMDH